MKIRIISSCIVLVVLNLGIFVSGKEIKVGDEIKAKEPLLLIDRYGTGDAQVVSNGYLFVSGKYIEHPYKIQRVGQGIVVNGILINRLLTKDPEKIVAGIKDWSSAWYGFNVDTPKEFAELQIRLLVDGLRHNGVAFINRSGQSQPREMKIPYGGKWKGKELKRVVEIVTSKDTEKVQRIKKMHLKGFKKEPAITNLLQLISVSTNLLERLDKSDE